MEYTRIVHQEIETADVGVNPFDSSFDLRLDGHIETDRSLLRCGDIRSIAGTSVDSFTEIGELRGDGRTDPTCGSGHECDLPIKRVVAVDRTRSRQRASRSGRRQVVSSLLLSPLNYLTRGMDVKEK